MGGENNRIVVVVTVVKTIELLDCPIVLLNTEWCQSSLLAGKCLMFAKATKVKAYVMRKTFLSQVPISME